MTTTVSAYNCDPAGNINNANDVVVCLLKMVSVEEMTPNGSGTTSSCYGKWGVCVV